MSTTAEARELLNRRALKTIGRAIVHPPQPEIGNRANDLQASAESVVIRLSDVQPERVEWLAGAHGVLPQGKLALCEGDPGSSKSTLALYVAARISRGFGIFDTTVTEPRNVILVTFEDGLADTIRPRIDAADGDPSRIIVFRGVPAGQEERPPTFPDDAGRLKRIIEEYDAALVIVDPLGAALGEDVDSHKDASVRRVTALLARVAEDTGACVLGIRHLVKGAAANAMRAGGGSIALIAAARVAMLVAMHPDDSAEPQHNRRRVLACVKNNLAPHPASRVFTVWQPDGHEHPVIHWGGESPLSADDLNAAHAADAPEDRDAAAERADWLRDVLSGGEIESADVYKMARAAGYTDRTLRGTAKSVGVHVRRQGSGKDHRAFWSLKSTPDATASPMMAESDDGEVI